MGERRTEAAVVVPIFGMADNGTGIVLIRRSNRGAHAGQIAFPGGRIESGDGSPLEAALRETEEEIGLARDAVEILEELPVVKTRTTGFRIHPFLARITVPPVWNIQEDEVAEVLLASVDELPSLENHGDDVAPFRAPANPQALPFIRVGAHKLLGVSYRILTPLLPRLIHREWD